MPEGTRSPVVRENQRSHARRPRLPFLLRAPLVGNEFAGHGCARVSQVTGIPPRTVRCVRRINSRHNGSNAGGNAGKARTMCGGALSPAASKSAKVVPFASGEGFH